MRAVLVVDDDPASLALVEATLEAEGYETRKAMSPAQALDVLSRWAPDVILLDMQLRGLDSGMEFARTLKANIATRQIPIIAFTAFGDTWSEAEARDAGCDGFLEKPISAQMLADVVRQAVNETE
jgi:CheY-like chemotaxis protein